MAWKHGFVIEYVESGRKPLKGRMSCSKCENYTSDKTCAISGALIREIGYDFWRHCKHFKLAEKYEIEELPLTPKQWQSLEASRGRCHPYVRTQLESGKPVKVEHVEFGKGKIIGVLKTSYMIEFERDHRSWREFPFRMLYTDKLKIIY